MRRRFTVLLMTLILTATAAFATGATAAEPPEKDASATGTGGAATTVDADATAAAMEILDAGGNAIDAAVAGTAALGVTEPYSSGVGGGGFMVIYLADEGRVLTIDSRETAPMATTPDVYIDEETGEPFPFFERVNSGLGVGVPGTAMAWDTALRRYGTMSLDEVLAPATRIADEGFVIDETFAEQTAANAERFAQIVPTSELFLVDGQAPEVGSIFRNPELADLYRSIAERGVYDAFYTGEVARTIVDTVQSPPTTADATDPWRPGRMTTADLADYETRIRPPTMTDYRGFEIFGMGPPSSGGSTVGEALNIFESTSYTVTPATLIGNYLQSTRLAFADRNAYLGDPGYVDVPLDGLLSQEFADERAELVTRRVDFSEPAPPGDPFAFQDDPSVPLRPEPSAEVDTEGQSTTHMTVSDADGNVVAYTSTIEQTGGSGMTVDGYGFLLNNELTDFNAIAPHPNAPEAGKRPRSSISPTIVLRDGEPVVAVGTPGGSTIITTVAQILFHHLDLGVPLPEAIALPRFSQRNTTTTLAEPAFFSDPLLRRFVARPLERRGYNLSETEEIGAATGIAFLPDGRVQAAAEPIRRGGGAAAVQDPVGRGPAPEFEKASELYRNLDKRIERTLEVRPQVDAAK
jgi:gamma-glutamyltranspeptidase/glutathione hydrolase